MPQSEYIEQNKFNLDVGGSPFTGIVERIVQKPQSEVHVFTEGIWSVKEHGDFISYMYKHTLSGSAENIDLNLAFDFILMRIEYFSNDATAKSFTTQVFSGGVDPSAYDQLLDLALNTDLPNAYVPTGEEGVYLQTPLRIRTAITASTAAKTLTTKITVKKLH